MIIVNIIFLLVFISFYAFSMKGSKEWTKEVDKKENKLYFLYPLAQLILTKTGLEGLLLRRNKVSEAINALKSSGDPKIAQKMYWYGRISLILLILVLFNLLSLFGRLQSDTGQEMLSGGYLLRPDYGEGSKETTLEVQMEASEKAVNRKLQKDGSYSGEITVTVEEKEYTEEELKKVMKDAIRYLEQAVLGENRSSDRIEGNLNFIREIPGTGIEVDWLPEDYDLISSNGDVHNEDVGLDGISTQVIAVLSYRNFKKEHGIKLTILPKDRTEEELLFEKLDAELVEQSEMTSKDSTWKLPDQLGDYVLRWAEKRKDDGTTLLLMGIVTAIIAWIYGDRELDKKLKLRKKLMLLDYPEIISKFTLLINAGMTMKMAWNKIVEDYQKKSGVKPAAKRYAYEEMLLTSRELKLGVSEAAAYERFGRRAGVLPYLKFSSMIVLNLKKGSKGLLELLEMEAMEAFEERKELAKRLGEEAGTKLLGPMMMMLILVLILIMIPAFASFRM